jgi:OmpA-OmpF porin, OOP family
MHPRAPRRVPCPLGLVAPFLFVASLIPAHARAADVIPHVELAVAHAVTEPQVKEFGVGGKLSVGAEWVASKALGLEAKLGLLTLSSGAPPADPRLEPQTTGFATLLTGGPRLRPFGVFVGPWASLGVGAALTGGTARLAVDAALGYDVRLSTRGPLALAPVAGFVHIFQPDSELRPADANVLSLGVRLSLIPARGDRDGDSVFDDEDACVDEPGLRTGKPETNGCPDPDRDHDGIRNRIDACPDIAGIASDNPAKHGCPDDDVDKDGVLNSEDACVRVAGVRTTDPKTNGCPRSDRDNDGIWDDEDACMNVFGIRTADPSTNGCPPADRDKDGVFDHEDACPDVAGVATTDPATNGCPPKEGTIRLEGERLVLDDVILFDLDSPRVRHASWPICQKTAKFILKMGDVLEITVEGHADATGGDEYNLRLSRARAESVRRLLIQYGVAEDRVKAEAFGRSRLRIQSSHAEVMNRRVEFWVTKTKSGKPPGAAANDGSAVLAPPVVPGASPAPTGLAPQAPASGKGGQ